MNGHSSLSSPYPSTSSGRTDWKDALRQASFDKLGANGLFSTHFCEASRTSFFSDFAGARAKVWTLFLWSGRRPWRRRRRIPSAHGGRHELIFPLKR
ncbi:MAG: hypothetical protein LBD67_04985 [Candidatus Accumulibacter sp.]|nr:hypothetical protein [Accumulibacter sp.]